MKKRNSASLETDEVSKIKNGLKERSNSEYDGLKFAQLYNLFILMLNTGLRANEIVKAIQILNFRQRHVIQLKCKGKKTRIIDIPLDDFLIGESTFLFENIESEKTLSRRVNKIGRMFLKNRTLTPHDMRATAITMLDWVGVPITDVMIWIGHKNLATTMKYLKRSPLRRRETSTVLSNIDFENVESNINSTNYNKHLLLENTKLKQQIKLLKKDK